MSVRENIVLLLMANSLFLFTNGKIVILFHYFIIIYILSDRKWPMIFSLISILMQQEIVATSQVMSRIELPFPIIVMVQQLPINCPSFFMHSKHQKVCEFKVNLLVTFGFFLKQISLTWFFQFFFRFGFNLIRFDFFSFRLIKPKPNRSVFLKF